MAFASLQRNEIHKEAVNVHTKMQDTEQMRTDSGTVDTSLCSNHSHPQNAAVNLVRPGPGIGITGGGQKLRTGSLVLPVADNIFK